MSNTRLWDVLGKTDPTNTKSFKRAGGFSGTAIKPMWSFKRMTEQFGPCGLGWGVNEPSFQVVPGCDGEVLVYCTVSVWYSEPIKDSLGSGNFRQSKEVFGVGGDKVVVKQSSGLRSDDEAFKKAYTDAIGNALKLIGVGADVHMGLFDDSKYVNEMRQEFSEKPAEAPKPETKAMPVAKRKELWASLMNDLKVESAKGTDAITRYMNDPEVKAEINSMGEWAKNFREEAGALYKMQKTVEDEFGAPGQITSYVAPSFDHLESLIGENNG